MNTQFMLPKTQIDLHMNTPQPNKNITVPVMHFMPYPEAGITAESLKNTCERMTKYCRENLTEEKYGPLPGQNKIAGGFHFPTKPSLPNDSLAEIAQLAKETKRRFRAGTTFELLFYMLHRFPIPTSGFFNSIAHIWDDKILFWYPCPEDRLGRFHLYHSKSQWRVDCGIFIIEEL